MQTMRWENRRLSGSIVDTRRFPCQHPRATCMPVAPPVGTRFCGGLPRGSGQAITQPGQLTAHVRAGLTVRGNASSAECRRYFHHGLLTTDLIDGEPRDDQCEGNAEQPCDEVLHNCATEQIGGRARAQTCCSLMPHSFILFNSVL
jgi:hypothetical protein